MKKYFLTLTAAAAALTTAAQEEPPRLAALTPAEAAAADSLAALRLRLEPKQIQSTFDTNELLVVDTLPSGNDALLVVLYSNNSWKY
ncbi:MAG: metalloendopeptidase, partial [Alistipes sp.]|nr:metalloendopeptidase [Alistipes sp.]